jgi:ferredoxin
MPAIIKKMNKRDIFIMLGIFLFLPPLSVIPQTAGEANMCGAVCPRMFFMLSPKGILSGFIGNINTWWFGASLVGIILITTLFFGRLWCSHVCPVGGATELVSRAVPESFRINYSFISAPAFRYGYFIIFAAGALIGLGSIACKFCNFRVIPFLAASPFVPAYRTYLTTSMGIAGLIIVGLTGFFAKGGRGYCNLLCPVGALDGIVNFAGVRFGFARRIKTKVSQCSGCGLCVSSCMVWALELDENQKIKRDSLSCMSCRECEKVCPNRAISYGKNQA